MLAGAACDSPLPAAHDPGNLREDPTLTPMTTTHATQMISRRVGTLLLVWHGTESPSDEDWDASLSLLQGSNLDRMRVLVITRGGAPTAAQQMRLSRIISGRPLGVAVLTDHPGVRFVASSFAFFVRKLRVFRMGELSAACAHLALDPAHCQEAAAFLSEVAGQAVT